MLIPLHIQFCILFQNFHQSPPPSSPYISKLCLSFTMTFWTASPCRSDIFDAMSRQDSTVPAFNEWTSNKTVQQCIFSISPAKFSPAYSKHPSLTIHRSRNAAVYAQELWFAPYLMQACHLRWNSGHGPRKTIRTTRPPNEVQSDLLGYPHKSSSVMASYKYPMNISDIWVSLKMMGPPMDKTIWTSYFSHWFPSFSGKKKLGISIPAMRLAALPRVLSMKSIRSLIALLIEAGMDRKITTCSVGILGFYSSAGWWYTNPSEKYESQLGWFQIYEQIELMFQTTAQIWDFGVLFYLFRALDFFMIFFDDFSRLNFSPRDDSGIPGDPRCRLLRATVSWAVNPFPSMLFIVILQVDTNENHVGNPDQYPKIIKTQMLPQSSSNL